MDFNVFQDVEYGVGLFRDMARFVEQAIPAWRDAGTAHPTLAQHLAALFHMAASVVEGGGLPQTTNVDPRVGALIAQGYTAEQATQMLAALDSNPSAQPGAPVPAPLPAQPVTPTAAPAPAPVVVPANPDTPPQPEVVPLPTLPETPPTGEPTPQPTGEQPTA